MPNGARLRFEKSLVAVARWVPNPLKHAILGRPSEPTRLAMAIHTILNRLPVDQYPILNCSGPLEGFRMRVDWRNHRGFVYGSWEPDVVDAISDHVSEGMLVLDVGAQSGFYTLLLSRLVGSSGKVVAFEPLPANFRVLVENIEMNGLQNVTARPEAVVDKPGTMEFNVPPKDSNLIAGPLSAEEERPAIAVPGTAIDAFADEIGRPIDFIKMDIEGAEGLAIRGATAVLCNQHPILLVELHNMDSKRRDHEVVAQLLKLGYSIEWLGEISWTSHILARWAPRNL